MNRVPISLILIAAVLSVLVPVASAGDTQIVHARDARSGNPISGDGQSGVTGELFGDPLMTRVVDDRGNGVAGVVVRFRLVAPVVGNLGEAVTNEEGIAEFNFQALDVPEIHTVTATIEGALNGPDATAVFQLPVRKPTWVWFMLFGLVGGLGLFLLGLDMMSSALQRSAGGRLRSILGALTNKRIVGLFVGALVTMMIQSSSATTVMLVSFVRAGLMSFVQTLGVILGADIGTTITAQLIAFKVTDYALLMIAVGFGLRMVAKRHRIRMIGEAVLGFGVLFFGMHIMSSSMSPLRSYQPFLNILLGLENPVVGILVGTLFTALIQSSSAFTGIIIVLAQQGFLTITAGIPLIFGANIGTCITAALASLNSGREAKRVALAHTMFKVAGVGLFVWWIPAFARLIESISPGGATQLSDPAMMARLVPRQIANAHTVFNVGLALIFLPLTGLMARVVGRLMPDKLEPEPEARYQARHLDPGIISTPVLALSLAKVEIIRMGSRVQAMAERFIDLFFDHDPTLFDEVHEIEEEIDSLDQQITKYLLEIGQKDLANDQAQEVYLMMHVTKQLEGFADIVDKDILPLARKKIDAGVAFSASGRKEVETYHLKMKKQLSRAMKAFQEGSLAKAQKVTLKQMAYMSLEEGYRQAHFERVRNAVQESVASSEIHIELMDCLNRLNSYPSNVARAMISRSPKGVAANPLGVSETN